MTASLVLVVVGVLAAFGVAWLRKLGTKTSSIRVLWMGNIICIATMAGYLLGMKREYFPLTPPNFLISLWVIIYVGIIHSLRIQKQIHEIQQRNSRGL